MATKKTAAPKASAASTKLADKVFGTKTDKPAAKKGPTPAVPVDKLKPAQKDVVRKPAQSLTAKRTDPSLPGVPVTKVRTLGDLRKAILEFPTSNTFTTDQKFGVDLIHIQNIRGRTVAQFQVEKKVKSTARADKL